MNVKRKAISLFILLTIIILSVVVMQTSAYAAAPDTFILSGPNSVTVNTSSEFAFGANEEPSTFECRLDAGDYSPCTSPYVTPDLVPGPHSFGVRATNLGLETDASPAIRNWIVAPLNEGDGSEAHPFTISECDEWLEMSSDLDAYYVLTGDVDCGATTYEAIGTENNPFSGNLNGNGYEISAVEYVGFNSDCILYNCNTGLFGKIDGATISNLIVNGSTFNGEQMVGTIAGTAIESQISDVMVFSNVDVTGFGSMGGLVGFADETDIENSAFMGNIAQTTEFDQEVGGLVGSLISSTISDSYSEADITSLGGGVGGIAGRTGGHDDIRSTINRSYSAGSISSTDLYNGGLVGAFYYGDVNNSFSVTDMTSVTNAAASGKLFGIFRASLVTQSNNYYNFVGSGPTTCAGNAEDTPVCEDARDLGYFLGNGTGNDLFSTWIANDPWNLNDPLEYPTFAVGNLECDNPTNQKATRLHYECTFFREMNEQYSGDEVSRAIRYKVSGSDDAWFYVSWPLDSNYFEISGLTPNTEYLIQLHVEYDIGSSDWASNYIEVTTPVAGEGDADGDSIKDSEEFNVLNNGDVNGDSILDLDQSNVASFINPITNKLVSVVVPNTCALSNVGANKEEANASADNAFAYTNGLVKFTANCGTVGVTIPVSIYFFEPGIKAKDIVARKYTSYNSSYKTIDGASVEDFGTEDGKSVVLLRYSVTDNSPLDNDQLANGIIVDPVGLGKVTGTNGVLSDTGANSVSLFLLALSILLIGFLLVAFKLKILPNRK